MTSDGAGQGERGTTTTPTALHRAAVAVLALAAVTMGGCMFDGPLAASDTRPLYVELRGRIGFEPIAYRAKLGSRIKTTAVHPADAGFLVGATSTQPDGCFIAAEEPDDHYDFDDDDDEFDYYCRQGNINLAPTAGLFVGIGTEAVMAYAGTLVRLNPVYWADGYREGIYSIRKQISDVRPDSQASYVYARVRPGATSVIPSAGVRGTLGQWFAAGEVGFPYQRWYAESGHDRFGEWQRMQSDHWTGFGVRYSATVGRTLDDVLDSYGLVGLFATLVYEDYERVKFLGERADISGVGLTFGVLWAW